jgi:thymidylate synthase
MTSQYERDYSNLLQNVLLNGKQHQARNGRTVRLFNQQLTADFQLGFPMLTGRKLPWEGIKGELLAFIRGCILLDDFKELGCNFWDKQALTGKCGTKHLGPIYGYQWRQFSAVRPTGSDTANGIVTDQLAELIGNLLTDPGSRRHIITAWQPNDLELMALPPCHTMAQWHVESSPTSNWPVLHCTVTMRSADTFVGVPADMASYALFTCLLSLLLKFEPGTVCINMADCHIYEANEVQVETYLQKPCYDLPKLVISQEALDCLLLKVHPQADSPDWFVLAAIAWLEALEPSDISLVNYQANDSQLVTMVA